MQKVVVASDAGGATECDVGVQRMQMGCNKCKQRTLNRGGGATNASNEC
jgi:hypothetical protein